MNFFLLLALLPISTDSHECGKTEKITRPYGKIEMKVDCQYRASNILSRVEYKGNTQHGFQMDYDSLWRKKDSCFFLNGKETGACLFWDTLGNIVGRETYNNGHLIGKREQYYSPGHPALIKNYDSLGRENGQWQEWWKNGVLKSDFTAKQGRIISGTEYYQDGKPRVKYRNSFDPLNRNPLKTKRIDGEAWAPNGKSTGKIDGGNGEWTTFSEGSETAHYTIFHEIYKDSLLIKSQRIDSNTLRASP